MFYAVNFDVVGTAVFTVEADDEYEAGERLEEVMAAGGDFARRAWDRLLESVQADGVEYVEPMAEAPITCDLPKDANVTAPSENPQNAATIGGARCPACGSTSIEGEEWEIFIPGEVEQVVSCNDRGARWTDVYAIARRAGY